MNLLRISLFQIIKNTGKDKWSNVEPVQTKIQNGK